MNNAESGHFNLFPLLNEVAQKPEAPKMGHENRVGNRWYQVAIKKILDDAKVPEHSGWYMWGNFNDAAWWQPLYIGKASRSDKWRGLYDRLLDELREESAAIFATVYGRDATTTVVRDRLNAWHKKTGKDWVRQGEGIQRALRKTGSTFIVWAASPAKITEEEIKDVEGALIHHYRAGFNVKRPHRQVMAGIGSSPLAEIAVGMMDREIEQMRGEFQI
jgi:hypothetical protein